MRTNDHKVDPNKKKTSSEVTNPQSIDWKTPLAHVLSKSEMQIISERAWSRFCVDMRDLCPETKWLSICEGLFHEDDQANIPAIQRWVEEMVATSEWPFPEIVILMSSNTESRTWKIIFPKDVQLPYAPPPKGLTLTPWKNKHSTGWKVELGSTFNSLRAGEA